MATPDPSARESSGPSPQLRVWWRELTRLGPHDNAHWPALRVGVCVMTPLALTMLAGQPQWAPYAIFGAMNSVYVRKRDYAKRLRFQVVIGLALTLAVFLGTAVGVVAPASWLAVIVMAICSFGGFILSRTLGLLPIPSVFLVFAAGTLSASPHTVGDLALAVVLPLGAAAFSVLVGQAGRLRAPSVPGPAPATRAVAIGRLWDARDTVINGVLHGLGPLIAGGIAVMAGIGHPYWAAVTATIPMVGATLVARLARGILRFLGTLVGVGVAYLLLFGEPNVWILIGAVAVLQVITELFITRNYGIAVTAITPMAIIMTHLGSPGNVQVLITDRVIETVIGAAVTMALLIAAQAVRTPDARSVR